MNIVGSPCPVFKADAVQNNQIITITQEDLRAHYTLFFFYPVDFSFVCPTELHALQKNAQEFEKRRVDVIAISVDSVYTHLAWLRVPPEKGGIKGFSFKLLSDLPNNLSKAFGVFDPDQGLANRGTFLIDENLIVQYGAINNKTFGRSIPEILRIIDAIQFAAVHGVSCPANWKAGQEGVKER